MVFEGTLLVSRLQLSLRGRVGDLKTRLSIFTTLKNQRKFMDRAISYPKEVVKFGILDHYDSLMKAKAKEKKKKKK